MNKKVLQLKGFPLEFLDKKWDTVRLLRPAMFQALSTALYDSTSTAYVYLDGGVLIDRLLEDGKYGAADMLAVNFTEFLDHKLGNDETTKFPIAPILYIYGVGEETSNSGFSDKVLAQLVNKNKLAGMSTIINSELLMPGTFTSTYPRTNALLDTKLQINPNI